MRQLQGAGGVLVDRMIRSSVRSAFHDIWWIPPRLPLPEPCIFIANHHGWHDGYVMYLATRHLRLPSRMWIQEYGAFPLFGKAGGMPFGVGNPAERAVTIRRTVRTLRAKSHNLVLFPEGVLHRPPDLLEFGAGLEFLVRMAPDASVVPVAIRYEMSMHERPECFIEFGEPAVENFRAILESLLIRLMSRVDAGEPFELLVKGKRDANERWDWRKWKK